MTIKQFTKPLIISLLLPLADTANAKSSIAHPHGNGPQGESSFYYIGIKGGIAQPTNIGGNTEVKSASADTTYTAGTTVGTKFMNRYDIELEYMYRAVGDISVYSAGNQTDSGDWSAKAHTLMLNTNVDLITDYLIRPYIKLGVGISMNQAGNYTEKFDGSSTVWKGRTVNKFAWQAGFGLNMLTSEVFDTNIEYTYVDCGTIKTSSNKSFTAANGDITPRSGKSQTGNLKDHTITIGAKFKF